MRKAKTGIYGREQGRMKIRCDKENVFGRTQIADLPGFELGKDEDY